MSQKLISLRVELSKRLADAQVLGWSRELSLAVTSIQSARMLFGSVAMLLGSINPYPQADNPKSKVIHASADLAADYVPLVMMDQTEAVKALRVDLQAAIDAATVLRRELWARCYETVEEALFDRALVELILAKQWLGEQLAVIAGHALVKPSREVYMEAADKGIKSAVAAMARGEPPTGATWPQEGAEGAKTEGLVRVEETIKSDFGTIETSRVDGLFVSPTSEDTEKSEPAAVLEQALLAGDGEKAVEAAKDVVDDTIRTHLAAGATITEICRVLNVTEYRVNKIKKAMPAGVPGIDKEAAALVREEKAADQAELENPGSTPAA